MWSRYLPTPYCTTLRDLILSLFLFLFSFFLSSLAIAQMMGLRGASAF